MTPLNTTAATAGGLTVLRMLYEYLLLQSFHMEQTYLSEVALLPTIF